MIHYRSIAVVLFAVLSSSCLADQHTFFRENVLGTAMELRVNATDAQSAADAERAALAEVERLSNVFSRYDANSELSRFASTPVGEAVSLSDELFDLLAMCDELEHASGRAFNPAVGLLAQIWDASGRAGKLPTEEVIRAATQRASRPKWRLDHVNRSATRLSENTLSLDAVAKGVILDHVAQAVLSSSRTVTGVMVNIGGDIRLAGGIETTVGIADPRDDRIGAQPLARIKVGDGGIATSGCSERSVDIDGVSYSHIIDPRTGRPVTETVSATVLAPTASIADALATTCSVLSVTESLALVNSIQGVDCLLVTAGGVLTMSANWPQSKASNVGKAKDDESTGHEMIVEFEIGKPSQSRRYRRPYVAVWIEDKDKFPVKTLSLFLMQNNPGPRWYRDLRRWYTDDQVRKVVDDNDLIETVSKPTRNPGKYKVKWDGRDDSGNLVKPGKYTLLIEAAREHGTYQLIRQPFEFGKPLKKTLQGNVEIASATVDYQVTD